MNIQEFKEQYPAYKDADDFKLANALWQKYYSHVPRDEFNNRFLGREEPEGMIKATGKEIARGFKPEGLREAGAIALSIPAFVGSGLVGSSLA